MNSFLPKRLISTCFTLMVALGVSAQLMTHDLEQQLRSPVLDKHYVGFCLYDMDEQRYVYGHNQDRHFTPASNTKIFTLFTSLTLIGDSIPGLAYVERGDSLIFWGTGDPSFLHPHLENSRVFDFLKTSDKKLFYARANAQESFIVMDGRSKITIFIINQNYRLFQSIAIWYNLKSYPGNWKRHLIIFKIP